MADNNRHIKAVVFDLGETLLNFGQIETISLFREGAKLSYDFLKDLGQPVGRFWFYCWRNLITIRMHCWLANITGKDPNALRLLRRNGTKAGCQLEEQQWRELVWLWYKPLRDICKSETDIVETLTMLKDSGIKLGILSNTFVNDFALERHLEELGIVDFFPVRLYSYQFDFRKPDPRIFRIAADQVDIPLERIMYVGDRINMDVEPAMKLGMTAVLKSA